MSKQGAGQATAANARSRQRGGERLPEKVPAPARSPWLWSLVLLAATVLVYQPVWHAGFIWDDDKYVTGNVTLHSLSGLYQIWFKPGATVQYYPLTFTVFWLEYHLWGLNPLGYHLVNVSLHAFNALLFGLVLRRLRVPGAWLAAILFALHPVCVESVAWITEHKNTLSGLFFLSSILAALKFWFPPGPVNHPLPAGHSETRPGRWKFYWLALGFYVLALGSKTAAVPLPAVLLLLIWWKRKKFNPRELYPLLPFFVVGVAMGLVTVQVEKHLGATGSGGGLPWLERCLIAGRDVWFYLGKLLWPHPLIFVYPRWLPDPSQVSAWLPALALAAVLAVLVRNRNGRGRPGLTALVYFLALLFPVLGFFNVYYFKYSPVSDHFQYLASLGPLALAPALIFALADFARNRKPWVELMLCGTLCVALGALTWRQCGMYGDPERLWLTTLSKNPGSWMAYNNLGLCYFQEGRTTEAIACWQKSLEIQPDDELPWLNLGGVSLQNGQIDEARERYQKALAINPDNEMTCNNLGYTFAAEQRFDEAVKYYRKAIQLKPDFVSPYYNLGNALAAEGQWDPAIESYRKALQLQPNHVPSHVRLGMALAQEGKREEAIQEYQAALRLKPNDPEALRQLHALQ